MPVRSVCTRFQSASGPLATLEDAVPIAKWPDHGARCSLHGMGPEELDEDDPASSDDDSGGGEKKIGGSVPSS